MQVVGDIMTQNEFMNYLLTICGLLFFGNIYFIKNQIDEVKEIKKILYEFLLVKQKIEIIEKRIEKIDDIDSRVRDLEIHLNYERRK